MTLIAWFELPWVKELWDEIFQEWEGVRATRLQFKRADARLNRRFVFLGVWTHFYYFYFESDKDSWEELDFLSPSPIYSLLVLDPNLAKARLKYGADIEGIESSVKPDERSTDLHGMWLKPNSLDIELGTPHNYLYILYHISKWSSSDGHMVLLRLLPQLLL